MKSLTEKTGEKLRDARLDRELTLKEVSDRSGVYPSHLSAIEKGKANPTLKQIERICDALGAESKVIVL